ncbi:unnamed protein product, partial [marine sediment metagenome]
SIVIGVNQDFKFYSFGMGGIFIAEYSGSEFQEAIVWNIELELKLALGWSHQSIYRQVFKAKIFFNVLRVFGLSEFIKGEIIIDLE